MLLGFKATKCTVLHFPYQVEHSKIKSLNILNIGVKFSFLSRSANIHLFVLGIGERPESSVAMLPCTVILPTKANENYEDEVFSEQ